MSRYYHVDIARHASDADAKWTDNLLSRFEIPGVDRAKQGVARRISVAGIYHVALIRRLSAELRVPLDTAVAIAGQLLTTDARHVPLGDGLEIRLDREAFTREVDARIEEAVESVVPARRGRPPAHRRADTRRAETATGKPR
ncbi:MAG TPA: hypothetical protein VHB25_13025 [Gemmatimonadaceae bacterium]|nr:hypothetical protein [Gemmatimonadaceae bacterium]